MDGELGTSIVRAFIGVVVGGLGWVVRGLFTRVRTLEAQSAAREERVAALEKEPAPSDATARQAQEDARGAKEELQKFKLCVAERYVRRDDYVTQMAGVLTRLDAIGVMVARVDERMKIHERSNAAQS